MTIQEVGEEYLDALEEAREARTAFKTNDGDSYDPCGDTERRVRAEFDAAVVRLAAVTRALTALTERDHSEPHPMSGAL